MPTIDPEIIYMSDVLLPRDPVKSNHAATKNYVDERLATADPTSHSHAVADITGLGTAATRNTGAAAGNVPILGANGKLPNVVLPALAISNTFVVATEAAMLASAAEEGDIAVRTDLNKSFILTSGAPTILASWQELLTPTDGVTSVNGRTGAVTVTLSELGGVSSTSIGTANGVASLNANGNVPIAQIPTLATVSNVTTFVPTCAAVYSYVNTAVFVSATSTPVANKIAKYDANGLLSSKTPTAATHVATKGYVDASLTTNVFRGTFSGNGTNTEFPISHNLNTKEIDVLVFEADTMNRVYVAYSATSVNQLTLSFATAPANGGNFIVIVRK